MIATTHEDQKKRRPIPGRTLRQECPKCQQMVVLNWRRSRKTPETIEVYVHPVNHRLTSVYFVCPLCKYRVSLGHDLSPYEDDKHNAQAV